MRPILFGKYQYIENSDEWDLHPRGIHFLTSETEKAWNIPMTWQTIRAKDASANDLGEAPIIFISGRGPLVLDRRQKQALKDYINAGGFIFAEACGGDGCGDATAFDQSFRAVMKELFPESSLEVLGAEHAVWTANFAINPRELYGLNSCCRTSVIYSPKPLSCYWQLDRNSFLKVIDKKIVEEIEEARNLGINVAAYATGRELYSRLSRPKIENLDENRVLENRVLTYPQLEVFVGTDDAPNAWENMLDGFTNATRFTIDPEKKKVPLQFEEMANYPFLFFHGRNAFDFTAEELEAVRRYLDAGNFLFVDSICSSQEFNRSFEAAIEKIFPGQLKDIPRDHPIWQDTYINPLDKVTIRRPDSTQPQGFAAESTYPRMKGVELDGRLVLVFSPLDLSCAMENAAANQCHGYSKKDASLIATRVLLYALFSD
ncbi:MAG: DUF4159 domain-containing protein [Pirellulaceae bacterium]